LFHHCRHILEIGSGTGQHAVYFAERIPHIVWHTSDLPANHEGICQWIEESHLTNVIPPICLDMSSQDWPAVFDAEAPAKSGDTQIDAVYSANTAHIMKESHVRNMFEGATHMLRTGGLFTLYGPFNCNGTYSSPSNKKFDEWLKQQNDVQGIRDIEMLDNWAKNAGLILQQDYPMPANNQLLCWRKL
jgi:cyclopropane fatty-acyl-phospholipid synthase-like methyltransferase